MNSDTKFFIGVFVVTIAIVIGAVFFFSQAPKEIDPAILAPRDAWATGSADPKLTLVEFSDFECPACGQAHPIVKQVVNEYKDQVRFVYRHFPLEQHPNALRAAEAAEAAGAQGKFWEMHDLLFENQANLSAQLMTELAQELDLDIDTFTKELNEGVYTSKVKKDQATGLGIGISSTPTFFLNGKKLSLFNFGDLKLEIEKALR